jgi:hypothetical protein
MSRCRFRPSRQAGARLMTRTSLSTRTQAARPNHGSCEVDRRVAHQRPPCCRPVVRRRSVRSVHCGDPDEAAARDSGQ